MLPEDDKALMAEIYNRHEGKIRRTIYRRTGNYYLSDDLTSEVFTRMVETVSAGKMQNRGSASWLYAVARNLIADHFRKANMRQLHLGDWAAIMSDKDNPSSILDSELKHEALHNALRELERHSEYQAAIIYLRFFEGHSTISTSEILGTTYDSVRSAQKRGVSNLRRFIGSHHHDL